MPSKGRILCAEDHPDTRELIVFILEDAGYEVLAADTAAKAIEAATIDTIDLLILDNWLPDIRVTKLTAMNREFDTITPILFYSALAYDRDKE